MDLREIVRSIGSAATSLLLVLVASSRFMLVFNDESRIIPSLINYIPRLMNIAYISSNFSLSSIIRKPMIMVKKLDVDDEYERALDLIESLKYALNFAPDLVGFDMTIIDDVELSIELRVITSMSPSHLGRVLVLMSNAEDVTGVLYSEYLDVADLSVIEYIVDLRHGNVDVMRMGQDRLVKVRIDDPYFRSEELHAIYRRIMRLLSGDVNDDVVDEVIRTLGLIS